MATTSATTATIQKPNITKPKKEGWLDKQSSFWKTYRKRWMVLQGFMLYSFKNEKEYDDPTEIFDLRIYSTAKRSEDGKTGQFELSSPNDMRIFCASSENEMKNWIKHIKSASNYKKRSGSQPSLTTKRLSRTKNPNTATAKTKKKKTAATPKKGVSASSKKKQNGTKKKPKTQKSKKVTNASMNKHIERMKKPKHTKSNSSESVKKIKKTKKKTKKPDAPHSLKRQGSVPNLANSSYTLSTDVN